MKRSELFSLFILGTLIIYSPVALADLLDEEEPVYPNIPSSEIPPQHPTEATPPEPPIKSNSATPKNTKTKANAEGSKPKSSGASSGSQTILEPKAKTKQKGKKTPAVDDSKQPVHFESKGLQALKEKGTAELIDDVVVTQGTMRLEADKAKIFYDDEVKDVVRVVAEGNVKIFKIDEETGEKIKAFGDKVEFDNKLRTVILDGNPRLWRGADLVRGKKITYELDTGWIRADRVAGEVHPQEDKKK